MITVGQARNDDAIFAAAARDRNDPAIIRAIEDGVSSFGSQLPTTLP